MCYRLVYPPAAEVVIYRMHGSYDLTLYLQEYKNQSENNNLRVKTRYGENTTARKLSLYYVIVLLYGFKSAGNAE